MFWFVAWTAFFTYGTIFSAIGIASGFIQEKYGFTNVSAGFLLVNIIIIEIVSSTIVNIDIFPYIWNTCRQMWNAFCKM